MSAPVRAGVGPAPDTAPSRPDARPPRRAGSRGGAPGTSRRTRLVVATGASLVVLAVVAVLAVSAGSSSLGVTDVVRTLLGAGTPGQELIVLELRLPRVVGAVVVGACLGLAGALTQTFARNPLATPDILGVTSGAGLGAVSAIVLAGGGYAVTGGLLSFGVPVAAVLGALVTSALVYGLSWRGGIDSYRLILIGIGMTASLGGLTSYLVARAQITEAAAATQWLVGSLSGMSWSSVWPAVVVLAVIAPLAATQTRALDVSQLGDDLSTGLGVAVQRHRLAVLVCAVLLTAGAVSAAGPLEFVAFVAPQVARRLTGTGRPPLVGSAVIGGLIVVGADLVTRTLLPGEVPVGILTAIIGAPYLIWLLIRHRKDERA
ncbi:FecCD family ABC transporter permease [Frigoribacterium faeni]|uniref:Iron complex transport system permease protein n=1 Tax=Frigoribacterium faeni TaxID=145483 RepID=A0A7W3JJX8_9MICO|nr:iron ABC transporter permease [Frigoribacterium faeni]MBA8814251.1 iron complex transport system permease protein [Frigoribacterium faeni]BFF12672.1 iron chelate uptake ABC transporter family permease subunit [Microbacterium flavescens]BFF16318.1 iron chelate uptake ABC transporter family permease subunit [Microbacterium flavescens]